MLPESWSRAAALLRPRFIARLAGDTSLSLSPSSLLWLSPACAGMPTRREEKL
jgi:hypothetical protein